MSAMPGALERLTNCETDMWTAIYGSHPHQNPARDPAPPLIGSRLANSSAASILPAQLPRNLELLIKLQDRRQKTALGAKPIPKPVLKPTPEPNRQPQSSEPLCPKMASVPANPETTAEPLPPLNPAKLHDPRAHSDSDPPQPAVILKKLRDFHARNLRASSD